MYACISCTAHLCLRQALLFSYKMVAVQIVQQCQTHSRHLASKPMMGSFAVTSYAFICLSTLPQLLKRLRHAERYIKHKLTSTDPVCIVAGWVPIVAAVVCCMHTSDLCKATTQL